MSSEASTSYYPLIVGRPFSAVPQRWPSAIKKAQNEIVSDEARQEAEDIDQQRGGERRRSVRPYTLCKWLPQNRRATGGSARERWKSRFRFLERAFQKGEVPHVPDHGGSQAMNT
ncbi:MAG: hypothetical protein JWN48_1302 [Myxococcaceae bacterium]|nr:hypothetical protein [Myxococcaceae bacterium]